MSDQLPITFLKAQIVPFRKLMDRKIAQDAEAIEVRQSRGPVAMHAIFITFTNKIEGEKIPEQNTYVISSEGHEGRWNV